MQLTSHSVRQPVDLSRLSFHAGSIGRLKTVDFTYVHAGDGFQADMVGSFRLSPLRRGLALDTKLEFFTFYIPMRYLDSNWAQMLIDGPDSTYSLPVTPVGPPGETWHANYLGINPSGTGEIPVFMNTAYLKVFNNYFKNPDGDDFTDDPTLWSTHDRQFGVPICHLKSWLTAPLPSKYVDNANVDTSGGSVNTRVFAQAEALLHAEQTRALFAQRYRDVVSMFGGSAPTDSDQRPELLQRSTMWASGYDVNGSDQASLGQFSGRTQQTFRHTVPRYFCREHGVVITVACARFPVVHQGSLTPIVGMAPGGLQYSDLIHDPAIAGSGGVVDMTMNRMYVEGSSSAAFRMAFQQWHRVADPAHVDERYAAVEGFPFLAVTPADGESSIYINPGEYDQCFQTDALSHFNIQMKTNASAMRYLVTTRDTLLGDE